MYELRPNISNLHAYMPLWISICWTKSTQQLAFEYITIICTGNMKYVMAKHIVKPNMTVQLLCILLDLCMLFHQAKRAVRKNYLQNK